MHFFSPSNSLLQTHIESINNKCENMETVQQQYTPVSPQNLNPSNPDVEISNLTFNLVCDAQWQYISVNS